MPSETKEEKEKLEVDYFLSCLEEAKKYGMEFEFLTYFFMYFLQDKDVRAAAFDALIEWDL